MLNTVLIITLWVSILVEGLWFFLGIKMGPSSLPFEFVSLIGLWFLALIGAILVRKLPLLTVLGSFLNLAGCIYLRNAPPGYINSPWRLIHYHLMDFIMLASSIGIYIFRTRAHFEQTAMGRR